MKGYGEYKTVNVQWLEKIPSHWNAVRNKSILRERKKLSSTGSETLLSVSQYSGVTKKNFEKSVGIKAAESLVGYKIVKQHDIVMNIMLAWNGSTGVSRYEGVVSPAYAVFEASQAANPYFLHYVFRCPLVAEYFKAYSTGIVDSRLRLYPEKMAALVTVLPPREEQDQIVRYLDAKVGKINKLIRIKQQQIALLKEKKQAIINQAVTKGLDPSVPMKDSGVAWIGQIPDGWEVHKIKQVAKILRGKFNHRPRNDERLYGGKFPFIQTGDVAQSGKYIESYKQTLNSLGFAVSKEFPIGTLVMTIAANIGDVSILKFNACFPDSIVGFIPRRASIEYLYFLFLAMKPELLKEAPVNTQGNLNVERIGQMLIPLPEESIQEAIVQKLNLLDSLYQKKITIIGEEIATLTEYRTRLISDVVTGKVDVRGIVVAEEPNEDQENSTSGHQWLAQSDEDEYSVDEDELTE